MKKHMPRVWIYMSESVLKRQLLELRSKFCPFCRFLLVYFRRSALD